MASQHEQSAQEIIDRTERWALHPWAAIEEGAIYTLDETDLRNPIKRFPKYPYLKTLTDLWLEQPLIAIPKSRRMLLSWLMCWLHLWLAMFREGAAVFIQSETEIKSNFLIQRAEFMFNHIPQGYVVKPNLRGNWAMWCMMDFKGLHSFLRGVPQGANQLRGYTASAVFMDEAAFWEKGRESFAATKPTVEGGGRVTVISSAQNGWFRDLCMDIIR